MLLLLLLEYENVNRIISNFQRTNTITLELKKNLLIRLKTKITNTWYDVFVSLAILSHRDIKNEKERKELVFWCRCCCYYYCYYFFLFPCHHCFQLIYSVQIMLAQASPRMVYDLVFIYAVRVLSLFLSTPLENQWVYSQNTFNRNKLASTKLYFCWFVGFRCFFICDNLCDIFLWHFYPRRKKNTNWIFTAS